MIESPTRERSDRLRPVSVWHLWLNPFTAPLMLAMVVWMAVVLVAIKLGELWRPGSDTAYDLDPSVDTKCPACQACLTLGTVDKRGRAVKTDTGLEFVMPDQTAECPACRRTFGRLSLGKVWTPWQERPDAKQGAAEAGRSPTELWRSDVH
ncbi:MAG TPA: hypothetical protein PLX97_01065 [Gemmatales bacterium]|nr:hypothetical protein [Gemmatales bacterium]